MFFFSKLTNDPGYQKNERICQSDLARESLMPPFWLHGAAMAPNSFRLMILIRHWRNGEMGGGGGQENIGNVTREGDRERGEQIEWGGGGGDNVKQQTEGRLESNWWQQRSQQLSPLTTTATTTAGRVSVCYSSFNFGESHTCLPWHNSHPNCFFERNENANFSAKKS